MALVKGISIFDLKNNVPTRIEEDNDVLKESIFNILTTRKGEIPGNPNFGTRLHQFLFEPNLEQFWEAIKIEVMNEVEEFEPRVVVRNVEFIANLDEHTVTLFIYFISLLTGSEEEVVIRDLTQF